MRHPSPRRIACGLLSLMLALATGAPTALAGDSSTPAAGAAPWQITSQELVGEDDVRLAALSPDGTHLALVRSSEADQAICAQPVILSDAPTCVPWPGDPIDTDTLAWSPDGTRFAFTEDAVIRGFESDIWVFDRVAGTVSNLTDDGQSGSRSDSDDRATFDISPAWSPNGDEIAFARRAPGPEPALSLVQVDATGGDAVEIADLSGFLLSPYADRIDGAIVWPEDDAIFFSLGYGDEENPSAIWRIGADGADPEQVFDGAGSGMFRSILVDVTAGGLGLIRDTTATGSASDPRGQFTILDVASGDLQPVTVEPFVTVDGRLSIPFVSAAAFSPDGGSLAMAVSTSPESQHLIIRDLESGDDAVVGELDERVGGTNLRTGLDWAANDAVFVWCYPELGMLLALGSSDADA